MNWCRKHMLQVFWPYRGTAKAKMYRREDPVEMFYQNALNG